jgi:GNAT superfamily N-acetyltransferase
MTIENLQIDSDNHEVSCLLTTGPDWRRLSCLSTVPEGRRQGQAGTLLLAILELYSDLPIYLEAVPFGYDSPEGMDLKRFYGSLGFKEVAGHPFAMVKSFS